MKKLISICFFFLCLHEAKAQNLIINGSFEDTLTCQQWINMGAGIHMVVSPWYKVFQTPDYWCPSTYLNFCGASAIGPNTWAGFKNPRTGVGMTAFSIGNGINRELIGEPMADTLQQNHLYYVEFYVSPGGNCQLQTDDIGAFLSDSIDPAQIPQGIFFPQIGNPQGNIINDTLGWTKISGYYTATGNECFVYIGNFKSDANTTYDTLPSATWPFAYYFLDDVSIVDCTATGINEQQQVAFNLLQNPVVNSVCFSSPFKINAAKVYSTLGVKVKECEFDNQSNHKIDVASLPRGVYFLQVESKDKRRGVRKFIKQ